MQVRMAANGEDLTEGPLSKWTNKLSGWQYRWFVLDSKSGHMSYYTSREKLKKGSAKGVIQLKNAKLVTDKEDECSFTITSEGKKYTFQAHDMKQREKWARAIRSVAGHSNSTELISEPAGESEESSITSKLVSQLKTTPPESEPNDIDDDDDDFFDALPVIVLPDSPQISSPESSLGKDSVGSRDSPIRQTAKPHSPSLDANHRTPVLGGATLGPAGDPAVRRATSSLALEKSSSSRHWRRTSVLSDGASMKEEGDLKVQMNIAEVKSPRQPEDVIDDAYHEEDDLAGSMQSHKSVVLHILAQLKPGVDLTRISLPAFILEKRSNLEMIADMFAYTDLYACIPTYPDPKERLSAVVRFCISTFPAGRKGANVKKPYNPVLGEVFRCYYELPEVMQVDREMDQARMDLVASGPIPWASYSSACYIAEQVSHHPPVSAFYAECPATGVCVLGSLQTKPKFMGLSVSIVNTGNVYITIPKLGEVYIMNIPNAYGRSILTQPWMEIGGKMNVTCEQTGCHAMVEFHCKPIYGGRKHRVTGELFGPFEKKPFMKLEGEWLDVIRSKTPNGETQEFFRAKDPQYKKKVKVLESMEPYESRRVWQHVTEALKQGQESVAADAKHEVEEKQREGVKARKEAGIEWKQKYFHQLDNGDWVYNDVIEDRWARLGIH